MLYREFRYLNLQQVITTNALVMHLMIGIVGIATALVLDEREAVYERSVEDQWLSLFVKLTVCSRQYAEPGYHSEPDVRTFKELSML